MSIEFTQFMMPNGRRKQVKISRPADIEALATELKDAGHRFEIEMLSDYNTISITVETEDENGDEITRAHELVANGPGVPDAVDKMMKTAYAEWQG